jgi:hypothetical protein
MPLQDSSDKRMPWSRKLQGMLGNDTGVVNTPNKSGAAKFPVKFTLSRIKWST